MGAPVPKGLTTIKLKNKLYLYQSLRGHLGLTTMRLKNPLQITTAAQVPKDLTTLKLKNELCQGGLKGQLLTFTQALLSASQNTFTIK
jgi:hypothetical protein